MSDIPSDLKYTATHEWIREEDDGSVTIGITDHAQHLLGDLVFIELPEVNTDVKAGDECCVIESVKAASDVYAPLTGEIVAINEALVDTPELVNADSYGDGWLFQIHPTAEIENDDLLSADEYAEQIAEED